MGQNTDVNFESHADTNTPETFANRTIPPDGVNPSDYNDVFKFSNAQNKLVDFCIIHGGKEDCFDINRNCDTITINGCDLFPQKYAMTIKGGSKNITISNTLIHTKPTSGVDIDLGNFTEVNDKDYAADRTTKVTLSNVTAAGRPVVVRVLNADLPTVIGGNVKVIVPWYVKFKLFKAWWWLRKHGVFTS